MQAHFSSVTIEGYRGIKKLEIEGLGQVNLITGRNNTGKSSVLEALRILAANGAPGVLSSISRDREEDFGDAGGAKENADQVYPPQVGGLFCGYPQLAEMQPRIRLFGNLRGKALETIISVGIMQDDENSEDDISKGFMPNEITLVESPTGTIGIPVLLTPSDYNGRVVHPIDAKGRIGHACEFTSKRTTSYLPCAYIRPFNNECGTKLGALWDKTLLSNEEEMVEQLLAKIAPDIERVFMVATEGTPERRIAIVRSKRFPRPVPLRSYGDGVTRLFGVILSLASAKDGLLLIDEFENGLHHTVQFEVWKGLFEIARRLNIQVFATSHSWDAVEAFQEAAHAFESDAALIRLTRKDDDIFPTLFSKEELAIATRDHIEVR